MSKVTRKNVNRAGFTLLEILVVLMIMGFLLAMVAPKLLGIFQDAEDTICDSNIKDSKKYVSAFEIQYSKLPDGLIVPGYLDDGGSVGDYTDDTYYGPTEESLSADGNEVFTTAILDRLRLTKHVLSQDEIDEIVQDLGIREVVVLNNPDDLEDEEKIDIWGGAVGEATASPQFSVVELASYAVGSNDVAPTWPMIGGGDSSGVGTGWANHEDWYTAAGEDPAEMGTIADPRWAYRLILGIGPDSELMNRIVAAEGTCPSFERAAADDTMWGWYVLVLPRLQATVDSLSGKGVLENITCWADSSDDTSQRKTFDLTEVDEEYKRASFDIFCPEGHRYPETVEEWGIETVN